MSESEPVKFTRVEAGGATVEIVPGDAVVRAGGDADPDHLTRVPQPVRKA